jgi:toxin FitB
MIILDTDVLAELMRAEPAEPVRLWVAEQPVDALYITATTQAEILHGLALLPEGRRHSVLLRLAEEMFAKDFNERILPFDAAAARTCALLSADSRRRGRPLAAFDAQIAAIARNTGGELATRNVEGFADCGIPLINPWDFRAPARPERTDQPRPAAIRKPGSRPS